MATQEQVKAYVACWLQMGKTIDVEQRDRAHQLRPRTVLDDGQYSPEFERNWRYICRFAERCYLSGTSESIRDLFQERWEIASCSRCKLLLPLPAPGAQETSPCPCADVDYWPNVDALQPRIAVLPLPEDEVQESHEQKDMHRLRKRLAAIEH